MRDGRRARGRCGALLTPAAAGAARGAVPAFIEAVKQKKQRLMGFGHRIYKSYDPRARIVRQLAYEVFDVCGREPLIDVAMALEQQALQDEYFRQRKLYPNVDFFTGLIYRAMGFPTDFFPVLFAIPRISGWLAHWVESMRDDPRIWRPLQVYVGPAPRPYVPLANRGEARTDVPLDAVYSAFGKRSSKAQQDSV